MKRQIGTDEYICIRNPFPSLKIDGIVPSISSNDNSHLWYFALCFFFFFFGSHPWNNRNGLPENVATDGSHGTRIPNPARRRKG